MKTFFQLLQIKRLQLKLTNTPQNSYQIQSQHQVSRIWVKQHPKTPQTTKTKRKSISKLFHAQTGPIWFQIASYLVPMGSYGFSSSQIGSYKLNSFLTVHLHTHSREALTPSPKIISISGTKNEHKTGPLYLLVLVMTIFPFLFC